MHDNKPNEFSLRDFFRVIFKYKGFILPFFLVSLLCTFLLISVWPETYVADASILVKLGRENVTVPAIPPSNQTQIFASSGVRDEDINSEIQLLVNREVVIKVIDQLGLDFLYPPSSPPKSFIKKIKYHAKTLVKNIRDGVFEVLYWLDLKKRLSDKENAIIAVFKSLNAKQLQKSDVIEVDFQWSNPEIAKKVLELILIEFQKKHSEAHMTSGSQQFFHNQVEVIEARLKEQEEQLNKLKKKKKISNLEEQIRLLLSQVNHFRAEIKITHSEIKETKTKISEYEKQMAKIQKSITPGFELAYKEAEKELMIQKVHLETLTVKEKELQNHFNSYKKELADLNQQVMEIQRIQRQIGIEERNYEVYSKKLEETRITDVLDNERFVNIKVISPADAVFIPIKPKKMTIFLVGIFLSLFLGILLAFLREFFDHSINNGEEVKKYLGLPLLDSINELKKGEIQINCQRLKNRILKLSEESPLQMIMVTSAREKEGVSSIAVHLAEALNADDKNVLIIDMNTHHPFLHKHFNCNKKPGIWDVLHRGSKLEEVYQSTHSKQLTVITKGSGEGNIFTSYQKKDLEAFFKELRNSYDFIIFDTPPYNQSLDVEVLGTVIDGVILVVQAGKTRWEILEETQSQLEMVPAHILGVVLNRRKYFIPKIFYK